MSSRVIVVPFRGDESSPLHCVVPFNRTACIRNVAGGRLPMNEGVIAPGNQLILIRCAEHHPYRRGTVHRPDNCQLSTVHCQLSTNCQLSIVNCQFFPAPPLPPPRCTFPPGSRRSLPPGCLPPRRRLLSGRRRRRGPSGRWGGGRLPETFG